jgi:hypothetical protein
MNALLTRSPVTRDAAVDWPPPRGPEGDPAHEPETRAGDGPTLADVVARSWEVLRAELPATCPVCGGELLPHASSPGGRCTSCGSSLT